MCRLSPFVIMLADADRAELERRARCYTLPHAVVVRAKIVLLAAEGLGNAQIAARLDVHVNMVSSWRGRFAREGLDGLGDRRRPGRPRVFPAAVVAEVKAMACEPPEDRQVPQSRWSAADLAAQARAEGLVEKVARSTVWRWLEEDAIRPWRYRCGSSPATRISRSRPGGCWTCTSGYGRAASWEPTSTCSAPTRSPSCRSCPAAIPGCRRAAPPGPVRVRVRAARHRGLPGRL